MKFCPICKIELKTAIFYNTEVDYCPRCLGIFFEEDELRLAKDQKDRSLRWLDVDLWKDESKLKLSRGMRLCPVCRLPLYEVYYGDSRIIVDVCKSCHGVWLERGEFKKIIKYLKEKADYKILEEYAKSLAEETWEVFIGPETFKEEILDFLVLLKFLNYKFLTQHPYISKLILELPK